MKYALLIYVDSNELERLGPEFEQQNFMEHYQFSGWLVEQGKMRGGEPLQPPTTATTVRVRNDELLTTDGPFAETKEHLAGFYLVECETLDEAVEAAAKVPDAKYGSIEVRPCVPIPESGAPEAPGTSAGPPR